MNVASDSPVAIMIRVAQNAIAIGFSPTARTLVTSALSMSTSRSSSSGADTTVTANTSAAPMPPSVIHTGKRFEPSERIT